ncbi:MAG: hypothetical protein GY874_08235, partial [Desulfobacteraceae bacterium]|nr:hypothetical protein [Desulfobacteraceae bacterium]
MLKKLRFLPLLVPLFIVIFFSTAMAYTDDQDAFDGQYPDSPLKLNCRVCHPGNNYSALNEYNNDWESYGGNLTAFIDIEDLDSDGDGVKNIDEINAGTLPGDSSSFPDSGTTDDDNDTD